MRIILVKSLVLASLMTVSAFVVVPLALLSVANGLLSFQVCAYRFFGLFAVALGAAIVFWAVVYFAVVGGGTPAPFDPPERLVTGGLFGYVRNPMYVGAVLVLFGEALFFEPVVFLFYAVFMWVFFHLFVVYY